MAKVFKTQLKQAKNTVDKLGSRQLRVGKKFKLSGWMLFDGIVLIIIISVAAVRLTHAGGNYTFTRMPQQMQGGTLERNIVTGEYRKLVSNGIHSEASATVDAEEIAASGRVCAEFHVASKDTFVDIQFNGHYVNKFSAGAGEVTVCAPLDGNTKGGTVYAGTSGNANVQSIYGVE